MMIIRPAQADDLQDILALAEAAGTGLTTLPNDSKRINDKIQSSETAFSKEINPESLDEDYYFFVLEDTSQKKVVGTSALIAAVGTEEPFYTYKLNTRTRKNVRYNVINQYKTLTLTNDYAGCSEIATLFLSPDYRGGTNGRLLAKSRFLFMADYPERFADKVIAEMRGYSDDNGRSPLWDCIGKHFFKMPFPEADAISGLGSNQFIADLMPTHPIYVSMLSQEAQEVLGQVHPKTKPAIAMLKREGFRYHNYVDIFDGGPTVEVDKKEIRSYKDSKLITVKVSDTQNTDASSEALMVSNRQLKNFRTIVTTANFNQNSIELSRDQLTQLSIKDGDTVRIATLRTLRVEA